MTPLRQRMIDAMVLRGFAARTQETYLCAVGQAARHHHCSPALLTDEQVQAYLLYLLQERQRSRSTVVSVPRTTPLRVSARCADVGATRPRRQVSNSPRRHRRVAASCAAAAAPGRAA
ncbi:MAG: phage integrase N-terminal SAM-like domain-containing protein [Rubrivivax sp.]|nr:phage integrase N-terminal SAM-like domain-containing protein [Rubrivivax sp.]